MKVVQEDWRHGCLVPSVSWKVPLSEKIIHGMYYTEEKNCLISEFPVERVHW